MLYNIYLRIILYTKRFTLIFVKAILLLSTLAMASMIWGIPLSVPAKITLIIIFLAVWVLLAPKILSVFKQLIAFAEKLDAEPNPAYEKLFKYIAVGIPLGLLLMLVLVFALVLIFGNPDGGLESRDASMDLSGYYVTCTDYKTLYKSVNGSWEEVSGKLPWQGGYYLDEKFVEFDEMSLGCDYLNCVELPRPYAPKLIEYKQVGERMPPSGSMSPVKLYPVFEEVPLSGEVKIEVEYFDDAGCNDKKVFSQVINVQGQNNG